MALAVILETRMNAFDMNVMTKAKEWLIRRTDGQSLEGLFDF